MSKVTDNLVAVSEPLKHKLEDIASLVGEIDSAAPRTALSREELDDLILDWRRMRLRLLAVSDAVNEHKVDTLASDLDIGFIAKLEAAADVE